MHGLLRRPHRTMTEFEQAKVLKVTASTPAVSATMSSSPWPRGTGLREHEALALDVGDITEDGATIRRRITLRVFKRCTKRPATQEIFLPDSIHYKLGRLLAWKKRRGESLAPEAPLFVSREGNRLSTRMARTAFRRWQQRAGLDRIHSFHVLRHTACTNLYRKTRDIRLVQRFARHVNIHTTTIYAQPSEEDLMRAVRELPC
jgi:integrase/recombinase XerC